jgi:GNAT superfamily N-acetyltransferase
MTEEAAKAFVAKTRKKEKSEKSDIFIAHETPDWVSEDPNSLKRIGPLKGYPGLSLSRADRERTTSNYHRAMYQVVYVLKDEDDAIGTVQFKAVGDIEGDLPDDYWVDIPAEVFWSILDRDYRKKGIGRAMYKMAINDLLHTFRCVRSDLSRSESAEGVWGSFCRANPTVVRKFARQGGDYYETIDTLKRRPVKVRRHRRAR